jgi:hypothetical protein
VIGGAGGPGTTAFHGHQKIALNSGLEMLIRFTGRWSGVAGTAMVIGFQGVFRTMTPDIYWDLGSTLGCE